METCSHNGTSLRFTINFSKQLKKCRDFLWAKTMLLVSYYLYYIEAMQFIFLDIGFTSVKHNYPEILMEKDYQVVELCQQN